MASGMKSVNCETLDLIIHFDEKQFKKKEFLLDVKPPKKTENSLSYSYGSKTKAEHAHLHIYFDGSDSRLRLIYHQGKSEYPDVREPYIEGVAKWIDSFFTEKELEIQMSIVFKYGKQYEPAIQLHYPLLVPSKLFEGVTVSGYEIDFPEESFLYKAIISASKESILVILNTKMIVELSDFDFHRAVTVFSQYPIKLVKKKEKSNVKSAKKGKN
jgi:hypothetical protein